VLFMAYDKRMVFAFNASLYESWDFNLQMTILSLSLISTFLAVIDNGTSSSHGNMIAEMMPLYTLNVLHGIVMVLPAITSVVFSISGLINSQEKAAAMRAAAGTLESEIWAYLSCGGKYSPKSLAENLLHQKKDDDIQAVDTSTMKQAVFLEAVQQQCLTIGEFTTYRPDKENPRHLRHIPKPLPAANRINMDIYQSQRVERQLEQLHRQALRLHSIVILIKVATFIVGAVGTILATLGFQIWVAVTTSIVAAMGSYMSREKFEPMEGKVNVAKRQIEDALTRWRAIPAEYQLRQNERDMLIEDTENAICSLLPPIKVASSKSGGNATPDPDVKAAEAELAAATKPASKKGGDSHKTAKMAATPRSKGKAKRKGKGKAADSEDDESDDEPAKKTTKAKGKPSKSKPPSKGNVPSKGKKKSEPTMSDEDETSEEESEPSKSKHGASKKSAKGNTKGKKAASDEDSDAPSEDSSPPSKVKSAFRGHRHHLPVKMNDDSTQTSTPSSPRTEAHKKTTKQPAHSTSPAKPGSKMFAKD